MIEDSAGQDLLGAGAGRELAVAIPALVSECISGKEGPDVVVHE